MSEEKSIAEMNDEELSEAFGMDMPRLWATSARVVGGPNEVMVIFRDLIGLGDGKPTLSRNVASIVMPKVVALEVAELIKNNVAANPGEDAGAPKKDGE